MGTGFQSHSLKTLHVYIHVPFCLRKCAYCSFYSIPLVPEPYSAYLRALSREIDRWYGEFEFKPSTLYFGGGTPSLLKVDDLAQILSRFDLSACREITLEVNPATLDADKARSWKELGINRVSLGAQSFRRPELALLGRLHSVDDIRRGYELLRTAGFDNISLDWMYGLPGQTRAQVRQTAQALLELQPEHISTYCLSLDPEVTLYARRDEIPSDRVVAGFYHLIRETLEEHGYFPYEISNFARPGRESQHNRAYWLGEEYLGLGPGASGYIDGVRYQHPDSIEEYVNRMERGPLTVEREEIGPAEQEREFIMLRLRLREGIPLQDYEKKFGEAFTTRYRTAVERFIALDMLELTATHLRLTPVAYFVANEIIASF